MPEVARRVIAACCLAAPFLGLAVVPFYTGTEPQLAGFPFFYWYQLAWVPVTAVLLTCAYRLISRRERGGCGRT